jgi:hypothetical protein
MIGHKGKDCQAREREIWPKRFEKGKKALDLCSFSGYNTICSGLIVLTNAAAGRLIALRPAKIK